MGKALGAAVVAALALFAATGGVARAGTPTLGDFVQFCTTEGGINYIADGVANVVERADCEARDSDFTGETKLTIAPVCISGVTYTYADNDPVNQEGLLDALNASGFSAAEGACPNASKPNANAQNRPARAGYCLNGVFENLVLGQPATDPAYKGATPAFYVDGVGITCDPPGGAFTQAVGDTVGPDGTSTGANAPGDIYPHYKKS